MTDLPADYWELEKQLRDELEAETEGILFEPFTQEGREEFLEMVHRIAKRRFDMLRIVPPVRIVCDESNNSPEDIDNGIVNVHVIPPIQHISIEYFVSYGAEPPEG